MSVKIYDGLKVKDNNADVFEIVKTVNETIEKIFKKTAKKTVYEKMVEIIDSPHSENTAEKSSTDTIFLIAKENYTKESHSACFYNDHKFSISFGKTSTGKILALPITNNRKYIKALMKTGLFEKYGYWDNSDRPKKISKKDWHKRELEWEEISLNNNFFALLKYSLKDDNPFNLIDWYSGKTKINELNKFYTPEDRAIRILRSQLSQAYFKKNNPIGDWLNKMSEIDEIVDNFANSEKWKNIELPKEMKGNIGIKLSELPPVYKFDNDLIDKLIENYENE